MCMSLRTAEAGRNQHFLDDKLKGSRWCAIHRWQPSPVQVVVQVLHGNEEAPWSFHPAPSSTTWWVSLMVHCWRMYHLIPIRFVLDGAVWVFPSTLVPHFLGELVKAPSQVNSLLGVLFSLLCVHILLKYKPNYFSWPLLSFSFCRGVRWHIYVIMTGLELG